MDGMEMLPNIPPYEILEELGRGSTGIVYKALDGQICRLVALKTIFPKAGGDWPTQCVRFAWEAQAMAACNHPNIVRVHAVGYHDGKPFVVREFVNGQTVRAELEKELLTDRQASKMMELVARPIQYMHERGMIHRNLTPDNVLITHDGTVKLIGFGKVFFIGGSPAVSFATDIQALGTMLFVLMTKKHWYPEGLFLLPDELTRICMKACNVEPENQYHSAMEVQADLRRYLQGK
jgi:serine/threonine protein kinase